jgi:LacI family transcriptional regulator
MQHLLALRKPPTAVFAVSDKTAMGAYKAVLDQGLSIPKDVSIVGFDNIAEARSLNPPLTTVEVSGEVMGYMAIDRLLRLINEDNLSRATTLKWTIPTKLVERESVRDLYRHI